MTPYDKIRAALELAASIHDDRMPYAEEMRRDELVESALAALAELERAAQAPVGYVTPTIYRMLTSDDPIDRSAAGRYAILFAANDRADTSTMPLYAAPPAPVVEIREAVITDEVARKVFNAWIDARWRLNEGQDAKYGHAMINVVRAELGPALGLVEIREPTPEECERIAEAMIGLFNRRGQARQFLPSETVAQVIFPAIRAVMWPKSEGL